VISFHNSAFSGSVVTLFCDFQKQTTIISLNRTSQLVFIMNMQCIFLGVNLKRFRSMNNAGLLARSQYSEGPATGHLDTGFCWFPCVYKQMLRWFPRFQVATTCFSRCPPDLNLVVSNFEFCIHVK